MSELWSSQQHEWLTALGHTLYVQGEAEAPAIASTAEASSAGSPQKAVVAPAGRVRDSALPSASPPRVPAAPRRTGSRAPDKLHFALIRASGCNPNAEDAAAVIAGWPPTSELRGNPAAKRALWPQLRALRRQRPT